MKNLPATAHTLFNQIYPRRFALAYYRAYAENNWMPKVCGNVQGLENPWGVFVQSSVHLLGGCFGQNGVAEVHLL